MSFLLLASSLVSLGPCELALETFLIALGRIEFKVMEILESGLTVLVSILIEPPLNLALELTLPIDNKRFVTKIGIETLLLNYQLAP